VTDQAALDIAGQIFDIQPTVRRKAAIQSAIRAAYRQGAIDAAAPDLLEALKDVTPSHRRRGECWCGNSRAIETHGHEPGCLKARAAIAKAEGRQ
jgi:hypothetical protein